MISSPPKQPSSQLPMNGSFFFSSRRRHTRWPRDWSSDVCCSDLAHIASTGADLLRDLRLKLPTLLSMIPYSLTIVILILIATFLITNDWYRLKEKVRSFLPNRSTHTLQNIVGYLEKSLFGFFKAQFILIFITGCLIFIG